MKRISIFSATVFCLAILSTGTWAQGSLVEIPVVAASAINTGSGTPMNAFNGIYTDYWHTSAANQSLFPKWLQADFGSPQTVVQVEIYNEKDHAYDVLLATEFAIWVGDDPTFAPGSYTVAAHITGNTVVNAVVDFAAPAAGRYLRYVVLALAHPELSYATAMYEMDIFTDAGVNHAPIAQSQSITVSKNTPRAITLSASDMDGNPLTYSIVNNPAHGTLSGTAPALTYTPATDYTGSDSFTFKANDATLDSNIATVSINIVSGSPVLSVVATVASSTGTQARSAFDGNNSTYWQPASDNFGYADRWVQADLGSTKTVDNVEVNFGLSDSTVATGFKVWIGDDPSFGPGTYTVVANVTGNTLHEVSLAVSPAVDGRWVRLIITGVAGPSLSDYQVTEMRIHGSDGPVSAESKYAVPSATASSSSSGLFPINAFNGNYGDFWHVSSDADPKWVQADLEGPKWVSRVVAYEYGGIGVSDKVIKHIDFQIWVGDDPGFAAGTSTVATTVTGNDDYIIQRSFTPVAGRYVRFVITHKEGPRFDYNCLYEMEIWGTDDATGANHPPIAQSQSISVSKNASQAITLSASDVDGDSLSYSIVSNPAHGVLSGTAPVLTYTPVTDYVGSDSFTFKADDGELDSNIATISVNIVSGSPVLTVVAAAATSANVTSSTAGNWPMKAFDGETSTFWQIASDNFGYANKWVQADLGNTKAIDQVEVNFGLSDSTVATGFKVWIGDDPSFGPGNYTEVANVTDNTQHAVSLAIEPAVNGRWVRLIITGVVGSSLSDYQVTEIRLHGSDGPASAESKYTVPSATASSYFELPRTAPINAFNGNYNDFWHVSGSDASSPKWVQADLGSDKWVSRVVVYEYGGVGMLNKVLKQIDFQIWVGDDPGFAAGTYTVAAIVTGNDDYGVQRSFTPTAGQYVRFVITHISGPSFDYNCLYKMEIWGTGDAPLVNHAPVAYNQSVYVYKNTPKAITLTASDRDGNPLTYSIVSSPAHGTLSGTAPALTYTPVTDYNGPDSFTFKANDGEYDSNIGTVNIAFIESNPYVQAVSLTQLYEVAAHLVEDYGPRRVDVYSVYTDNACTLGSVVYPKSNMERADDYLKALYESWGYQVTLEEVNTGYGVPAHNVVATKIGSVYPNIFIDVGGHLDTQPTTPGAGDNASGSTAVVEIGRVLKDYPNRYSIRFVNDVGHETCGNCGMAEHVRLLLARGEQIKAGLMMDGIGWSIIPGANNNEVWWNSLSPGTQRIMGLFDTVRSMYGIDINFNGIHQPYGGGDGQPYLDQGLPAIMSIGGTPYNAPGYHGCGDTMAVMDMQNILKITQQNLAVMLLLDQENESNPPQQTLSVEKVGNGTVTSDPVGIDCGVDCSEAYTYNTLVTLTAVPATGSAFTGWSGGGCSGTSPCVVTMDGAKAVTASFMPNQPPTCPDIDAGVVENHTLVLYVAKLLRRASDPDAGDTLSVTAAGPTSANGPANNVVLNSGAGTISYTPGTGYVGLDSFTYTISDNHGATVSSTVHATVTSAGVASPNIIIPPAILPNGHFHVGFAGIPGYTYTIQYSPTPTGPWTTITVDPPLTAGTDGLFEFVDPTYPAPFSRYYRTIYP